MSGRAITISCRTHEDEEREASQAMLAVKSTIYCARGPARVLLPFGRRRGAAAPSSMSWLLVALVIVIAAGSGPAEAGAGAARTVILDFEGVGEDDPIGNFYGPGGGGGPTKNYGIVFGMSAFAAVSTDAGGSYDFVNEPSPNTTLVLGYGRGPFLGTEEVHVTVRGGFTGLSFQYAQDIPFDNMTVTVFAGPDGTGAVLGIGLLPVGSYDEWRSFTVPFSCGVARSAVFTIKIGVVFVDDMVMELAAKRPARLSRKGKKGTTKRCMKSKKVSAML
jgi:hypothetical protein